MKKATLPFSAVVGQDEMKMALLLNAVHPAVGGVLIRGERGTAKSTTVRALADLLPSIRVAAGCRFNCDPDDPVRLCTECAARIERGESLKAVEQKTRVVELPSNASADRVVGSIDMEAGIVRGEVRFEPGLLAAANRNILYVDEVNLLEDHVVDLLLDAAAMGTNIVEREGVSFVHPSRFILVGTMNPEEGELRPQLLDRFGICVDVTGSRDVQSRVEIIERSTSPQASAEIAAGRLRDAELVRLVVRARELVPMTQIDATGREMIAAICVATAVVGHRADIVIAHTARALCAWREASAGASMGGLTASNDDILLAADFALAHRRRASDARRSRSQSQEQSRPKAKQTETEPESSPQETPASESQDSAATADDTSPAGETEDDSGGALKSAGRGQPTPGSRTGPLFSGELFAVRKLALPRDRRRRRGRGKRTPAVSEDGRGRYVRSQTRRRVTDVAIDATLRAAAPHQARRRSEHEENSLRFIVERQDLRQKIRHRKTGTLIVFVVDASASMDAEQRMQVTKGAVLSLLRDAYLRRDKVAVVVFAGRNARVVLSPTSSVDLAQSRLERLGVGGTTPLTHGLVAGLGVIRSERLRDPNVRPLMVLISDGRGNISLFGEEPALEAQRVADQIGAEGIQTLVVDSSRDHVSAFSQAYGVNTCKELAERSKGDYLGLFDLSQNALIAGVQKSLRAGG